MRSSRRLFVALAIAAAAAALVVASVVSRASTSDPQRQGAQVEPARPRSGDQGPGAVEHRTSTTSSVPKVAGQAGSEAHDTPTTAETKGLTNAATNVPPEHDPVLGERAFDAVPAVRTGAGAGRPANLEEGIGQDGARVSSVAVNLDDPASWSSLEAVFDPIFATSGFTKGEVVRKDTVGFEYLMVKYRRSSMGCDVVYSAVYGPTYLVTCIG